MEDTSSLENSIKQIDIFMMNLISDYIVELLLAEGSGEQSSGDNISNWRHEVTNCW
jgi:hypothetical protein